MTTIVSNTESQLQHIRVLAAQRLQALGHLGDELANPPDEVTGLWVVGILAETERLQDDLNTLRKMGQLLSQQKKA